MAPLSIAIVACLFAAGCLLAIILDMVKVAVFARRKIA